MKKGYKMTEEHKRKIGLTNKIVLKGNKNALGHKCSDETRLKMRLLKIGKKFSEEHRKNIGISNSISLLGNKNGLGNKSRIGQKHSQEVREKLSLSHIGFKHSEESKRKMSEARKGIKYSAETIRKMSIANKKASLYRKHTYQDTSIEIKIQNFLKENSIPFETNYPILGRPDIFIEPNICIFADGCYWHSCPTCGHGQGKERDRIVTQELQNQGYVVVRLWEHEIKRNLDNLKNKINTN